MWSKVPVNFRVPLAFASLPVPLSTAAWPVMLKISPFSSPHAVEPGVTLNVSFVTPPLISPVPVKGTQGCWEESPVPSPEILLAPTKVPLPAPDALIVTMLSAIFVVAVPL